MSDRQSWPIWKAVARRDNEILVADEAFAYSDDFHGVTGTCVYGVTQAMINEARRSKREDVAAIARDMDTTQTVIRHIPISEWLEMEFETPEPRVVAAVRALPGFDADTYPRLATGGGGRIFGHKIMRDDPPYTRAAEPIDADLLRKINDYDDGITKEWN